MFDRGLIRGYEDYKVFFYRTTGPYAIHSTFPVKVPADLKGRKIQAINKIQVDYLTRIGATSVGIIVPKVAEALSRGSVDGAMVDMGAADFFRILDAADHHMVIPLGTNVIVMLMRKDKFESLPEKARHALDVWSTMDMARWINEHEVTEREVWERLEKDPKHKVYHPTDSELQQWKDAIQPSVGAWLKENPRFQELLPCLDEEIEKYRAGK